MLKNDRKPGTQGERAPWAAVRRQAEAEWWPGREADGGQPSKKRQHRAAMPRTQRASRP